MLAMLYNTDSSRYRSFNRIYPSIIDRKYRFRNTFQRYSDTTGPHFTFFHQHPSRQKSLTQANTVISLLPVPRFIYPSTFLPAPDPDSRCITRSGADCFCVAISRLPILEFPGLPAAHDFRKVPISSSAYAVFHV